MLRWVALLLVVLLVALQVQLWTGHGGLRDLWRLQQNITAQKQDNAALRKRNDTLAAEVEDLKHGSEAIEERARAELGLLKPGELFIQVVEPAPDRERAGRRDEP
ncbi:MAG: cell division protein FtsB [Xanthomonadales bacterium]|nr:MAG: cell division protein FtsB [Dokdonella sp.]MBC6943329.1 cell division protein FtsB [Xanthomonadales bacterium]MCC6597061.1 cell division protein FtsB [Rhodanobacteraceae bacterium]MDL1870418.1 cell division protein FtsB [Gammaproteobacteria bacterium PRO6]